MNLTEVTEQTKHQLAQVTGLQPVTVTGTFKDEVGWHVHVDMLEMRRVPDSTDVLGYYEVLLTDDGTLVNFKRKCSHLRCEAVEED